MESESVANRLGSYASNFQETLNRMRGLYTSRPELEDLDQVLESLLQPEDAQDFTWNLMSDRTDTPRSNYHIYHQSTPLIDWGAEISQWDSDSSTNNQVQELSVEAANEVQDFTDLHDRRVQFKKYFRYFLKKAFMKHMVVYDINALPDTADISLHELFEYFDETNKLVWDSRNGKKPIIINIDQIKVELVDAAKYKNMEELTDFLARKIIEECELTPRES